VDASLSLAGLTETLSGLLEAEDYEGAEELLLRQLSQPSLNPQFETFLHFQMGRLYGRWNKLSSAIQHLALAAEQARQRADEILLYQVLEEFKLAKHRQLEQRP
jgi:hypothetical protein